ncbi:MAG: ABC transporter substrate-binding protein [Alistipes sp.]|nr:ABC transporter substrate-binding protein [Alistipes sp.]
MRCFAKLVLLCTLLLHCVACHEKRTANLMDFDVEIYSPSYATGFAIVGAEGWQSSILEINNPWQGAEDVVTRLFIAREGELPPDGFDGQVIEGNANRVICMSSSHVAMLDFVGKVESIVGVSGIDFISNEYVASHRDKVFDVGPDSDANFELVVALDPDIVLLYGVTGACAMENKLRELGIPYAYIGEYLEQAPLGKSEWLIAIAEIVGCRAEAETAFAEIPQRYEALKELAAQATTPQPKVMINTPYADTWFMASTSSYIARLIADAGGDYIYKRNTSSTSLPIDLEQATLLTSAADVWINVGSITSLDDLRGQFPKFGDVECVRNGSVYNCDRRSSVGGGNDFWESGVVYPDIILRDLIKIFHPELISEEFVYYRRLE